LYLFCLRQKRIPLQSLARLKFLTAKSKHTRYSSPQSQKSQKEEVIREKSAKKKVPGTVFLDKNLSRNLVPGTICVHLSEVDGDKVLGMTEVLHREIYHCQQVKKFCLPGFISGLPEFRRLYRRAEVSRRALRIEAWKTAGAGNGAMRGGLRGGGAAGWGKRGGK
jgi:hypothetical protein